ncbi:MAG: hypothetical protein QXI89_01185 [Candidatus Anstonellales archaeon]
MVNNAINVIDFERERRKRTKHIFGKMRFGLSRYLRERVDLNLINIKSSQTQSLNYLLSMHFYLKIAQLLGFGWTYNKAVELSKDVDNDLSFLGLKILSAYYKDKQKREKIRKIMVDALKRHYIYIYELACMLAVKYRDKELLEDIIANHKLIENQNFKRITAKYINKAQRQLRNEWKNK